MQGAPAASAASDVAPQLAPRFHLEVPAILVVEPVRANELHAPELAAVRALLALCLLHGALPVGAAVVVVERFDVAFGQGALVVKLRTGCGGGGGWREKTEFSDARASFDRENGRCRRADPVGRNGTYAAAAPLVAIPIESTESFEEIGLDVVDAPVRALREILYKDENPDVSDR